MDISQGGLDLIKRFEAFRAHVYKDAAGHDTVGWGHLLTPEERASGEYDSGIDDQTANDLLHADISIAVDAVNRSVSVPLTQAQFDALVSFTYNVGAGAFARSSVRTAVNAGNWAAVPGLLALYNKVRAANGQLVANAGLARRRALESDLFAKGGTTAAASPGSTPASGPSQPAPAQPEQPPPVEPGPTVIFTGPEIPGGPPPGPPQSAAPATEPKPQPVPNAPMPEPGPMPEPSQPVAPGEGGSSSSEPNPRPGIEAPRGPAGSEEGSQGSPGAAGAEASGGAEAPGGAGGEGEGGGGGGGGSD